MVRRPATAPTGPSSSLTSLPPAPGMLTRKKSFFSTKKDRHLSCSVVNHYKKLPLPPTPAPLPTPNPAFFSPVISAAPIASTSTSLPLENCSTHQPTYTRKDLLFLSDNNLIFIPVLRQQQRSPIPRSQANEQQRLPSLKPKERDSDSRNKTTTILSLSDDLSPLEPSELAYLNTPSPSPSRTRSKTHHTLAAQSPSTAATPPFPAPSQSLMNVHKPSRPSPLSGGKRPSTSPSVPTLSTTLNSTASTIRQRSGSVNANPFGRLHPVAPWAASFPSKARDTSGDVEELSDVKPLRVVKLERREYQEEKSAGDLMSRTLISPTTIHLAPTLPLFIPPRRTSSLTANPLLSKSNDFLISSAAACGSLAISTASNSPQPKASLCAKINPSSSSAYTPNFSSSFSDDDASIYSNDDEDDETDSNEAFWSAFNVSSISPSSASFIVSLPIKPLPQHLIQVRTSATSSRLLTLLEQHDVPVKAVGRVDAREVLGHDRIQSQRVDTQDEAAPLSPSIDFPSPSTAPPTRFRPRFSSTSSSISNYSSPSISSPNRNSFSQSISDPFECDNASNYTPESSHSSPEPIYISHFSPQASFPSSTVQAAVVGGNGGVSTSPFSDPSSSESDDDSDEDEETLRTPVGPRARRGAIWQFEEGWTPVVQAVEGKVLQF